ncbi:MAG TPA: ATP-binding protein, partial [Oligoflexus sp.]|uniref:ATP-binding protein n=1 Tax=Oligoflexus sp. TaxID=1971216 RepID=UPI002D4DD824
KVEAGKLEIEKNVVEFPELMTDIQMVMGHFAEEKGIVFSMTADNDLPATIFSDAARLKQVLTNVIGNAIKFTGAGSVTLNTRVDKDLQMLRFLVRDTGRGMTPVHVAKIFKPFTQGDSATTREFGGTGLGLELSRRLARALGGDVTLVESRPGVGSVFEILIALEGASYEASSLPTEKTLHQPIIRLDGVSVLLAEDAIDNQFLVTKFLTLAGAHVEVACDGLEAVGMASANDYDIILMDIQMPHLDGYQATLRLRKLGCKVPILALTAHAMRDEIERCRRAGCDAHLSKPIGMQKLLELVHRSLLISGSTVDHGYDAHDYDRKLLS